MTEQIEPPAGETPVKAIALLSGGLDSILAARLVQDQGVDVLAVHFITPFFGDDKRGREAEVEQFYREKYDLAVRVVDVSDEYLEVLANPRYGYGKNFNPCIDCKIFLVRKALDIMHEEGARFLITGEVLGQRPMSQRRDAMNAISKQAGVRDILLRPLSAQLMPISAPERHGWVRRDKLYDFSGRNRKPQMELAAQLGITDYPTPAGGCRLTDPTLAQRVRHYFELVPAEQRRPDDIRLLLVGRPFRLPGGSWFTMGRNQGENKAVARLAVGGDEFVRAVGVPGPLGLLRLAREEGEEQAESDREAAAAVLLRYCGKAEADTEIGFGPGPEEHSRQIRVAPAAEESVSDWRM